MTARKANGAGLSQPVAPQRWAQIRQGERVDYATAQPMRMSWKASAPYTCPELRHRSTGNQPPSLVLGKRVAK